MFVNYQEQLFQRLNNEEGNRQCEIPNFVKAQMGKLQAITDLLQAYR